MYYSIRGIEFLSNYFIRNRQFDWLNFWHVHSWNTWECHRLYYFGLLGHKRSFMDKVRLKKKWDGQEKVRKNWTGDRETLFLSIIDVYNPISDIKNIQFIMWRYAKTPHSVSGVLEFCERSEQKLILNCKLYQLYCYFNNVPIILYLKNPENGGT